MNLEQTAILERRIENQVLQLEFKDMPLINLPENTRPLVFIGDVVDCLNKVPDESVSAAVTSPPYWGLRDYYVNGQIGHEKTSEEYIDKLFNVFKILLKKLTKEGAFFLNIGDTYIDKGLQMIPQRLAAKMIKETEIKIRSKRVGWLLRNQIIWNKPNHMPSPAKCRFTSTYEPIYFFTRDDWEKKIFFDLDNLRIPYKTKEEENNLGFPKYLSLEEYEEWLPKIKDKNKQLQYNGKFRGHEVNVGASPGGRSSITGINYVRKRKITLPQDQICDYLRKYRDKVGLSTKKIDELLGYDHTAGHWFRNDAGGSLPTPADWLRLKKILKFDDKFDKAMTEEYYVLQTLEKHPKGKNPGDIWEIKTAKLSDNHFAVFPEELPRRAIIACCPPKGIVLDPFAGSGTTGKVAKELNRKSILIELQKKFLPIIKKRCGEIEEVYVS